MIIRSRTSDLIVRQVVDCELANAAQGTSEPDGPIYSTL